jgi:carbamoyltransferase
MVDGAATRYGKLLSSLKALTGRGVLLNTSFNLHGEPLVCSPHDAIDTLKRTGNEYLVMGNYLVRGKA